MTITVYNFAKPARLTGDWSQRLTGWFYAAFALATKAWAKELSGSLEASVCDIDIARCGEILSGLGEAVAGYRVALVDTRLPTLLILPRPLLLTLVDGLLGQAVDQLPADRELTDVERPICEYFLQTLWLAFFKDTWPGAVQGIWEYPQAENNPQCSRLFAPDELVVVFTCEIRGPFGAQTCTWLFQKKGLAELMGWDESDAVSTEPQGSRIETLVRSLPLDVVVVLGGVEICISQLSQLRVGDVILLNQRVVEPLTALIGDEAKFRGWAGRSGSSIAFRIDSLIEG
jgi:flagellar motor switch protein FliM